MTSRIASFAAGALIALGIALGALGLAAQAEHEGTRWEYTIAHFWFAAAEAGQAVCEVAQVVDGEYTRWQIESNPEALGADCQFELLNQLGAEGWELVNVRQEEDAVTPLMEYWFKHERGSFVRLDGFEKAHSKQDGLAPSPYASSING
jgi:hypothetical protein